MSIKESHQYKESFERMRNKEYEFQEQYGEIQAKEKQLKAKTEETIEKNELLRSKDSEISNLKDEVRAKELTITSLLGLLRIRRLKSTCSSTSSSAIQEQPPEIWEEVDNELSKDQKQAPFKQKSSHFLKNIKLEWRKGCKAPKGVRPGSSTTNGSTSNH